ncbi:MAG: hypothetical protein JNL43_15710 [Flavobacteriales bacterium]|nr:hypothetical protein [Flavobacteriales bacterium]
MIAFWKLLNIRAFALGLLLIGACSLHAQPFDTLVDRSAGLSAETLIERDTSDVMVKWTLLDSLFGQYLYLGRPEECMKVAIRSLELAESTKSDTLILESHLGIGAAFTALSDVNGALKHFNIAFDLAEQIADSLRMGRVCKEIAIVYMRVGDTEGTLRYMRKA